MCPNFLSCILALSQTFTKYSSGILIFIIGGFLVLGWVFSKRVIYGSRRDLSNTQLTGMTALIAGSYGASTVIFLRAYLRTICMEYAEYGLVGILQLLYLQEFTAWMAAFTCT